MLAAIEGMIAELRQIGVPVSIAERIDAMQSLRHLPVGDRATVKAALRAILVKTHDHEFAFNAVFDLYFTAQPPQASSPATENSRPASPRRAVRPGWAARTATAPGVGRASAPSTTPP